VQELFQAYQMEPSVASYTMMGDMIGVLGRGSAYSWRYVQSAVAGTVKPGAGFRRGILKALAASDGAPKLLIRSTKGHAFFEDAEGPESYVMGRAKRCSECNIKFVPNVPYRIKCPQCSPPRRRRADDAS